MCRNRDCRINYPCNNNNGYQYEHEYHSSDKHVLNILSSNYSSHDNRQNSLNIYYFKYSQVSWRIVCPIVRVCIEQLL